MLLTHRGALGALSVATLTALTACGRNADAADPNASSNLVGEIHGADAISRFDTQDAWMSTFVGANLCATAGYAGGDSGARRTKLVKGAVDFADTDTLMTADKISRIGGTVGLLLYISLIAVAYNLPGFTGGSRANTTGEILTKVLSGAITRQNNPTLATLNPGAALPDLRIIVVSRSDGSGTTKALTTYLVTVASKTRPHESEEAWSLRDGQSGDGTTGMIQTISAATGTIGYVDTSKVPATLGTVAAGSNGAYVPVSAKAAAAALDTAILDLEANETHLLYQPSHGAEGAYPIVLVSYLITRLHYNDARIVAVVKACLRFIASTQGQDASTKATGYAPIIQQMREKINAAIDRIAVQGRPAGPTPHRVT